MEATNRATVAAGFVRGVLSGLDGRDPRAVLAAAGLTPAHREGPARTPIEAYAALYNAVVGELGDEGFGLFSAPIRPGAFEFLCRGVIGAPTLGEALQRAARFLAVVLPDLEVRVEIAGPAARLVIAERRRLRRRASDPRRVFAFEWLLRLLHGLACWLAGRGLTLDAVAFPYPAPPHAAEYSRVYAERSTFDAAKLVAEFDASLMALPVRRDSAELEAFLAGGPGKISMLYRRDREVARGVRETLAGPDGLTTGLDDIARALHVSPRSLHRRLSEEGTSFRAIKDTLRRNAAMYRLEKTPESVAAIAAALGYSEPSAFFRAFVSWTGRSPSAWRKERAASR